MSDEWLGPYRLLIRSGFFNGIIAYGVSFIHSHLESWRVLFLIEGLMTIFIATLALIILPENVERARWLSGPEKDYREQHLSRCLIRLRHSVIWRRSLEIQTESNEINWKHARSVLWRWQTIIRESLRPTSVDRCSPAAALMYQSQQISGAALAAFMPTFTSENGFKGANAQIATLAPYGAAAVSMIVLSYASDYQKNRGWYVDFGYILMIAGFGIYLGVPATSTGARFAALIFAEAGHYSEVATGRGVDFDADGSLDATHSCMARIQLRKRITTSRGLAAGEQSRAGRCVSHRVNRCMNRD